MEYIPDDALIEILSYLPTKSYLPTCHVSKRFQTCWFHLKQIQQQSSTTSNKTEEKNTAYHTHPLQVGNLFDTSWNATTTSSSAYKSNHCRVGGNILRTSLLEYYISCGWIMHRQEHENHQNESNYKQQKELSNLLLRRVLLEAAARGDVHGISFLTDRGLCNLQEDEKELCTVAGAAGRIDALKWLREERHCAWDATEVYREALENAEWVVMSYVDEVNPGGAHEIQMCYSIGLPW